MGCQNRCKMKCQNKMSEQNVTKKPEENVRKYMPCILPHEMSETMTKLCHGGGHSFFSEIPLGAGRALLANMYIYIYSIYSAYVSGWGNFPLQSNYVMQEPLASHAYRFFGLTTCRGSTNSTTKSWYWVSALVAWQLQEACQEQVMYVNTQTQTLNSPNNSPPAR